MISPNDFKALRVSKGLTQKELADIVGTTQTTITNIEKGITKNPSVDIALKIANALDKSIQQLFGQETFDGKIPEFDKKEIDRLKILVFHSLDKYESDQIFLKQFDYNQEDTADWEKFKEYERYLSEFKKGILGKLIEVGFCSHSDIKEYRAFVLKQAKERQSEKNSTKAVTYIDPSALQTIDEISEMEIESENLKLQNDPNYIPEIFKTPDGRPFIRKDIVADNGKVITTFTSPDQTPSD